VSRIVCWFSCGAASAYATKLAIEANAGERELVVVSIFLEDEHPDSDRFLEDCEKWFGQEIIQIADEKYGASVDKVIASTKYMSGARGARCTKELKKQVRLDWQRDDDTHVFGMHIGEEKRVNQLIDGEPDLDVWPILVEEGIDKQRCFDAVEKAGIEMPEMYKLGYHNNNCIGCLKAQSAGYWNKIRQDFPKVFETRAEQERLVSVAMCRVQAQKFINEYEDNFRAMLDDPHCQIKINAKGALMVPLRYLPPDVGKHDPAYVPNCGFFCETT